MITKFVNGHEVKTSAYYNFMLDLIYQFDTKTDAELYPVYEDAMSNGM